MFFGENQMRDVLQSTYKRIRGTELWTCNDCVEDLYTFLRGMTDSLTSVAQVLRTEVGPGLVMVRTDVVSAPVWVSRWRIPDPDGLHPPEQMVTQWGATHCVQLLVRMPVPEPMGVLILPLCSVWVGYTRDAYTTQVEGEVTLLGDGGQSYTISDHAYEPESLARRLLGDDQFGRLLYRLQRWDPEDPERRSAAVTGPAAVADALQKPHTVYRQAHLEVLRQAVAVPAVCVEAREGSTGSALVVPVACEAKVPPKVRVPVTSLGVVKGPGGLKGVRKLVGTATGLHYTPGSKVGR